MAHYFKDTQLCRYYAHARLQAGVARAMRHVVLDHVSAHLISSRFTIQNEVFLLHVAV